MFFFFIVLHNTKKATPLAALSLSASCQKYPKSLRKCSISSLSIFAHRAICSGVGGFFLCALQIFLPSSSKTARRIMRLCLALWYWFTITRGRCISLPSFVVRAVYVWCLHLCRVRLLHPISYAAACRVFRLSRSISCCDAFRFIAYF